MMDAEGACLERFRAINFRMNGDRLIPLARRYRLLSVVGRGGMGTVWRAYDEVLDRDVAVKEVHLPGRITKSERKVMCRRLLAEARATAALKHPGVVAVHDLLIEGGRPWIVMEFLESCSLNRLVTEDGPLGVRRTAEIGAAVLSVLRASHAAGILHRDVKPSNVLLCDDGRVLLTDFGLAVHMDNGQESADTMPAGIEGSPAYLPPERVNRQQSAEASDLWSLGATLYTAVEGFSPFLRCHALASMVAVLLGDYPRPVRAGPLTPVIEGLLRQRPEDRLTAEATAELLQGVMGNVPAPGATRAKLTPLPQEVRGFSARRLTLRRRVPWAYRGSWVSLDAARSRVFRGPRVPWTLRSATPPGDRRDATSQPCGSRRRRWAPGWRRHRGWWPQRGLRIPRRSWRPRVPALLAGRAVRPGAMAGVVVLAAVAAGAGTWAARWTSIGKSDAVALRPASDVKAKTAKYREAGAYSVRVPAGWQAERRGPVMHWKDVHTGRGLRISPASGDPLDGLRAEERAAVAENRYPGYHRLRLEPVPEVIAGAAEWEFTWRSAARSGAVREPGRDSIREHRTRHVLCSRAAGYEFCFYAPDRQWTPGQRLYDKILRSFRPEKP
ncbi:serine/threonine protein kinase [Actinomadura soli]|uniref:non-specific serine/threonine protein kinase n=1 Tax=Actinomadura soli TaxID=2508997 RepID=A0A5C4J5V6_9ACTN|nr:serine/threonine-protein kinase [Actinomadura soli]TMQ92661.1 serine/threonine protein kinase [Actinomadura soli]